MKSVMGIYCILNMKNGKKYVGSSVDILRRWNKHKKLLRKGNHENVHLQNAWNKYEEDSFEFLLIEKVDKREKLIESEQYWIKDMKVLKRNKGYNIAPIAGSTLGFVHSEKSKKKMSEANIGEKSYRAKLTWEKVREIREKYNLKNINGKNLYTQQQLANEYAVHSSVIGKIVLNKAWKEENFSVVQRFGCQGINNHFFGKRFCGENHPCAKLTWEKVKEIRRKYKSGEFIQQQLADEYGITRSIISHIICNRIWKIRCDDI